jgi:uncharacterized 2Fe-2S/4Fe-4S cluster protein (DUF4445 family)
MMDGQNLVTLYLEGKAIEAAAGTTILKAMQDGGILQESPCSGKGICGKCRVWVNPSDLKNLKISETHHITAAFEKEGCVLACQAQMYGDVRISRDEEKGGAMQILAAGESFQYELKPRLKKELAENGDTLILAEGKAIGREDGDTRAHLYGAVIDIGTTTLAASLLDIESGRELSSVSSLNPQSLYAQDVLSRIQLASKEEGLKKLNSLIKEAFNKMLSELAKDAGVLPKYIYEVIYSGNTTMLHLAVGENPASLGKFPYVSKIAGGEYLSAKSQGINISPFGSIYLPPVISAFVGPDITSGILASRLHDGDKTVLFIDIGTNGEMVIAKNGHLFATSTAAGPAFEGMNIEFGMRAELGAIEYFSLDEDDNIDIRTIGNVKPKGICGSGLFDVAGELVRCGVIGKNGRFALSRDKLSVPKLWDKIVSFKGKKAFAVAEGVYLTQKDVRQIQLAKGAVRAGTEALLKAQKVGKDELSAVEIAGSFGYHLREESLINIGIIPRELKGKIKFVGNTSKEGGKAFLLHYSYRKEMKEAAGKIESIELSKLDGFDDLFIRSLNF